MRRARARLAAAGAFALLATGAEGQGLAPLERKLPDGATVLLYGQINRGVLSYDDGRETETYAPIDNDNSGSRIGLTYTRPFGDWTFQNVNEFQCEPFSTADINILQQTPTSEDWGWSNDNIRIIDFTFEHPRHGKIWVGQGSMATDGVADMDLSETTVVASSSVGDSAAAQIFRFSDRDLQGDASLSGIEVQDVVTNYDGDRRVRVRYDTPSVAGFTLAAAFGRDLLSDERDVRDANLLDASLTWEGKRDAVEVEAAVGWFRNADGPTIWGGSASAIHTPTGLNLTVSAANQDEDDGDGSYWYAKLGLLRPRLVGWGATAVSVDYYSGEDIFLDASQGDRGSTSESWGMALVQDIDRINTDLWLTWRTYDYADDTAGYDRGQALFGGAIFSF